MIKRIATYAVIGIAAYAVLWVVAKLTLALEPLVPVAVLATLLFFVGREIRSSRHARAAKHAAPSQTKQPEDAGPAEQTERTWAFLQGLGQPLCRALASLPPDGQAPWLQRAAALERQVEEIDRWVQVIRSWPEHQRQSVRVQVERRMDERTRAIQDFAQALLAASNHAKASPAAPGGNQVVQHSPESALSAPDHS